MTKKKEKLDFSTWSKEALEIGATAALATPQVKVETVTAMLQELADRKGADDESR